MKLKEFISHDWKIGETVYYIQGKFANNMGYEFNSGRMCGFCVPCMVTPVKVTNVIAGYEEPWRKKGLIDLDIYLDDEKFPRNLTGFHRITYNEDLGYRDVAEYMCSHVFFTEEEAKEALEKERQEALADANECKQKMQDEADSLREKIKELESNIALTDKLIKEQF